MKDFVQPKLESLVDENKQIKHSKLTEMTEEVKYGREGERGVAAR